MLDILIVENNLFEQSVMQTMLRAFGARQVRAARNGKLAIRSVLSRAPDIILLDREIGEPSGLDVARFIRLASKSPDNFLPMIMVTSHAEQCQIVEARDAGINAVILKPFSPQTLYRHVLKVIAAPRQFVRTKNYFGPDRRSFTCVQYTGEERRKAATPRLPPSQKWDMFSLVEASKRGS